MWVDLDLDVAFLYIEERSLSGGLDYRACAMRLDLHRIEHL